MAEQLDALEVLTFGVADMAGLNLGAFTPSQITLDADAAGHGWYLDGTPLDDAEFGNAFSATRMQTDPTGGPAGHYDLLTTVMHEMGHALGLGDSYAAGDGDDLMYGWLYTGERRLPGEGQAEGAVIGATEDKAFLGTPIEIGKLPSSQLIVDFAAGTGVVDVVEIHDFAFADINAGLDAAVDVSGGVFIGLDGDDALCLQGVTKSLLVADDFLI